MDHDVDRTFAAHGFVLRRVQHMPRHRDAEEVDHFEGGAHREDLGARPEGALVIQEEGSA
eukprot:7254039-Pyramimonas_sp.AAC.1